MDATILLPTTIARPNPGVALSHPARHAGRTPRWALAAALAAAILAAAAGGIVDGGGAAGPAACAPRPLPGGAGAAAACVAHPIPGIHVGPIIAR